MVITNFWSIVLDDHWSKKIYRPKMIVWSPVLYSSQLILFQFLQPSVKWTNFRSKNHFQIEQYNLRAAYHKQMNCFRKTSIAQRNLRYWNSFLTFKKIYFLKMKSNPWIWYLPPSFIFQMHFWKNFGCLLFLYFSNLIWPHRKEARLKHILNKIKEKKFEPPSLPFLL